MCKLIDTAKKEQEQGESELEQEKAELNTESLKIEEFNTFIKTISLKLL